MIKNTKVSVKTVIVSAVVSMTVSVSFFAMGSSAVHAAAQKVVPKKPNILLIMVDDMGYSEIGAYGGEIRTPNIDALAKRGVKFTDFYVAPSCSPTRSMLLSGTDSHLAGVGSMHELISGRIKALPGMPASFAALVERQQGQPGYEGYLNKQSYSFPVLLQDAGYKTYMTGKWHLGYDPEFWPNKRGFDHSFALLDGGASHFSDAWAVTPPAGPAPFAEDGKRVEKLPDDFYSTTSYMDKLIGWLEKDLSAKDAKPFFAYYAPTAPHDPLHVPDADAGLYAGQYDAGYDVIREQRIARMQEMGLLQDGATVASRLPMVPAWDKLPPQQQKYMARSMEVYAAMVEIVDREVGRLISMLEEKGELDNTIIFFLSDNGAGPQNMRHHGFKGDEFDNSPANWGKRGSYISYGPGWAQAGSLPFNLFKGSTGEGGIRAPLIVAGPGVNQDQTSRAFAHVTDITATLLDVAGQMPPRDGELHPVTGKSLMPVLNGRGDSVRGDNEAIGWELMGMKGLRQGNWKITFLSPPFGRNTWAMYDLSKDPAESVDVSAEYPEQFDIMMAAWKEYATKNGVIELE